MGTTFILISVALLLVALMALRVPVGVALLAAGAAGLLLLDGPRIAAESLARVPFQAVGKTTLIVIPMFVLMGMFAKESGLAERIFEVVKNKARHLPGGLAVTTILAGTGFGAVSGSSAASVATIGKMSIGEMVKAGYLRSFSAGTVASAGTLGILIPPSIALVVYGQVTQEPIGQLLLAGIVPGLLSALAMIAYVVTRALLKPEDVGRGSVTSTAVASGQPKPRSGFLGVLLRILILFGIVVGGIYFGLATPTESAALGAAGAFLMLLYDASRGGQRILPLLQRSFRETVSLSAMIFGLLIGASIFSTFLVRSGAPRSFADWATSLAVPPEVLLLVLLLLFVPLGMFVDGLSMIVIAVPITYPVITELGFDGIWYGVLAIKLIEIGLVTPPLGLNAYVAAGTSKEITVESVFRGAIPFILVDLAVTAIIMIFPALVLWLPMMSAA